MICYFCWFFRFLHKTKNFKTNICYSSCIFCLLLLALSLLLLRSSAFFFSTLLCWRFCLPFTLQTHTRSLDRTGDVVRSFVIYLFIIMYIRRLISKLIILFKQNKRRRDWWNKIQQILFLFLSTNNNSVRLEINNSSQFVNKKRTRQNERKIKKNCILHCTFLIFFCYFSSLSALLQVFFYHIFSSVQHFTQNSFSDFIFTIPSCRSLYVTPLNLFPRQENNEIQHFFFYLFKFLLIFYLLVLLRAESWEGGGYDSLHFFLFFYR